ncbi:hypothetical protein Goklo_024089 [Gossypium klotzschianum]|uniref:RNase H type-1 domain-containing protein n=1 Tax=Gossypium klotzschianum TaxID=34286 RepID=A0A7J8WF30_9ROSI|nr:hypothetical protein [Gossypium klotzschianum]
MATTECGLVKVNVDGSFSERRNSACVGGAVRDCCGEWLGGFTMSIDVSWVFQLEARALYVGLQFAWDRGFRSVAVESDNALLRSGVTVDSSFAELRLAHVLSPVSVEPLLAADARCFFQDVSRELNIV